MYFQGTKMEFVNQHKPQFKVFLYHVDLITKRKVLVLIVLFQFVDEKNQCVIHYLIPNYHFLFVT